jgi:hypothetical protein
MIRLAAGRPRLVILPQAPASRKRGGDKLYHLAFGHRANGGAVVGRCRDAGGATATPFGLGQAWQEDWSPAATYLQTVDHLYTVGRGLHLGIAQEAAHKLKETCMIHAEAYSSAEVLPGQTSWAAGFSGAPLPLRGCK